MASEPEALSAAITSRTFSIYYPDIRPGVTPERTAIVSSTNAWWEDWQFDDEARLLTGESDPARQARSLAARGAGMVAVTLGGDGLLFVEGETVFHADGYPIPVVDQTGAGDAFAAGLTAGLVRGLDARGCLAYGSALGASCVRAIGCSAGVFTAAEADRFMAEHPLSVREAA